MMVAASSSQKTVTKSKATPPANVWSFLTTLVDRLYNLLHVGKIAAAIILAVLVNITLFTLKYPNDELPVLVKMTGKFFYYERFYVFPLGVCRT